MPVPRIKLQNTAGAKMVSVAAAFGPVLFDTSNSSRGAFDADLDLPPSLDAFMFPPANVFPQPLDAFMAPNGTLLGATAPLRGFMINPLEMGISRGNMPHPVGPIQAEPHADQPEAGR